MTAPEKFCLKWNDFQKNIDTAIGSLRQDEEFSDVTLASEDGKQIEAHRVILAASSPFFQNMLKRNKHTHPLIYMRGIKSDDLVSILDFLYYGETNIYQENLDSFLKIAEELSLKGLSGGTEEQSNSLAEAPENDQKHKYNGKTQNARYPQLAKNEENANVNLIEEDFHEVRTLAVSNISFSGDLKDLDEKVKSMMISGQNMTPDGRQKGAACSVCGKEGYRTAIRDHIEANHIVGVVVPCNICEKTFRSRNALRVHTYNHK